MQVNSQVDPTALIERLVAEATPRPGALDTWRSFLQAYATLMRRLAGDLVEATGLTLGDFDVLAQLAVAGGELRMSELAARAYSSRSAMTRRVARLVHEGLLTRASDEADARGVVVALTEAGVARLAEAAPVHLRGVVELFVCQLTDEELALLKSALDKVMADSSFGT